MPYKPKITTRGISTSTVSADNIPKGAALTNSELDSNFLNLRDASIGIASDDSTVINIGLGNTLKVIGAGGLTTAVSGQSITIDGSGIEGDTGDLSFSGTTITSASTSITLQGGSAGAGDLVFRDILAYDSTHHGGVGPSDYIGTGGIINAITCEGDLLLGAGYTNQAGTEDSTNNIVLDARITRLYGDDTQAILTTAQEKDLVLSCFDGNSASDKQEPFIKLHGQPFATTARYGDIELKPARDQSGGASLNPDGAVILDELYVRQNTISTEATNQNIKLQCNGTGTIQLGSNLDLNDNLITSSTGSLNVKCDKNIVLSRATVAAIVTTNTHGLKLGSGGDGSLNPGLGIGYDYYNATNTNDISFNMVSTGRIRVVDGSSTQTKTTIGANGAAAAPTANPVGYLKIKINDTEYQVPYYNV